MSLLVILLVVCSACMHGTRDFLTKQARDKQVFIFWYELFALLFYSPVFFYFAWTTGMPTAEGFGFCLLSACCHVLYWFFMARAYERGDISLVYPIMRASPALVLILSLFLLHESLSPLGILGILLTTLGVYSIHFRKFSAAEWLRPIQSFQHDQATRYALLTMVAVSIYSIIDKMAVSRVHPLVFVFVMNFLCMLLYAPYIFFSKARTIIIEEWHINRHTILANGFFLIFGYALILIAYQFAPVSYVQAVRQLSIIVAVVLGGQLLKEEYREIRLTAAGAILVGSILIAFAG